MRRCGYIIRNRILFLSLAEKKSRFQRYVGREANLFKDKMNNKSKTLLIFVAIIFVVFMFEMLDVINPRVRVLKTIHSVSDHKLWNDAMRIGGQQHTNQVGRMSPLCRKDNRTTIIVYSQVKPVLIRQFFAHNKEVEDCKLPDNVTTCFFTNDSRYYHNADVLYIRSCNALRLINLGRRVPTKLTRAYPEQLVMIYNRAPERDVTCNNPIQNKLKNSSTVVSYTLASTIPYPYLCWPDIQQSVVNVLKLRPPIGRHGVAMFVSNCRIDRGFGWRKKYLMELMNYIHIDSYGACLHNTDVKSTRNKGTDLFAPIKLDTIKKKQYKFLISFENSVLPEYVSEKIWHAYLTQTIPIYYGAPEVYKQVPGNNTYIDAAKFAGPKELAEYIKKVDQNESLYRSYFNFDINRTINFRKICPTEPLGCTMCKHLYHLRKEHCRS